MVGMDWDLYSYVVGSKYRRKVMLSLDVERTPSQIARRTGISTSHVSRVLTELEERRLVRCLVPAKKVGRVYRISGQGKVLFDKLAAAEEGAPAKDKE